VRQERWLAEIDLVQQNFPWFTPFELPSGFVGFAGMIRNCQVVIKVPANKYPAEEPKTYIDPKPEEHHWIRSSGEPYLCYQRNKQWDPARSTFANCILIAVRYINDFT
jgi:hypothetical protein